MDIVSLLLILALTASVAVFLVRPFVIRQKGALIGDDHEISTLEAEQDRILSLLQETEMDHIMGKILPEDYQLQRTELLAHGATVLRQLDELVGDRGRRAGLQAGKHAASRLSAAEKLEAEIAALRGREGLRQGYCPKCGQALYRGDQFCSRCGNTVESEETTP